MKMLLIIVGDDLREKTIETKVLKTDQTAARSLCYSADKRYGAGGWVGIPDLSSFAGYYVRASVGGECMRLDAEAVNV